MQDDTDITTADSNTIDGDFFIQGERHTVNDYLDGISIVLNEIETTGSFTIGANTLRSMTAIGHAIGISKAKLLHGMYMLWNGTEEAFYEYIMHQALLSSRILIERYIGAWKAVLHVPDTYLDLFINKPMKDLNALGAAISQGYIPDLDEWEKLADASSNQEFLQIIREDLKGKPARKNSITIYVETTGDLVMWSSAGPKNIGYLNITDRDDMTVKAITRIINSSGLILR